MDKSRVIIQVCIGQIEMAIKLWLDMIPLGIDSKFQEYTIKTV